MSKVYKSKESANRKNKRVKKQDGIVNFYQVLGVEDINAPLADIKKKYYQLVQKYHPDRNPDVDPSLFALIQRAWECLGNKTKREEYNVLLGHVEKVKKTDYLSMKDDFKSYMEAMENDAEDPAKKAASQLSFDKEFADMDSKRGFDRKKLKEAPPTQEELVKKWEDLETIRKQEEIELSQPKLFEGKMDLGKFNALFDLYNEKNKSSEMIKAGNGPVAFNLDDGFSSFTTLDNKDSLFNETDNIINKFTEIGDDDEIKIDISKLKTIGRADYTYNHNQHSSSHKEDLERKIKERQTETDMLSGIRQGEFNTDAEKDYTFSREFGFVSKIDWNDDDNDDLVDACNKLLTLEGRSKKN